MKFKVGDKVRLKPLSKKAIIDNTVLMKEFIKEHNEFTVCSIKEMDKGYIRIGEDNKLFLWCVDWFEKADPKKIKIEPIKDEIKLEYYGRSTVAMHNEKLGTAFRSYDDDEDRKVGILIATMRALGFKNKTIDTVIDVLFDDFVDVKYLNNGELLQEVQKRMK